mgnify:CR=1 FL=1
MSKTLEIKVRFTQTQLSWLKQEALLRNMSVSAFVRHIVRLHKGNDKTDINPYLKGLERNGITPPSSPNQK